MQRRKFLVGMGSLAAGSAAAMGTGAVSQGQYRRGIEAQVVGDKQAYMQFGKGGPQGAKTSDHANFVKNGNEQFALVFKDNRPNYSGPNEGTGVNFDSINRFDGVFFIANRGLEDVNVDIKEKLKRVSFYISKANSGATNAGSFPVRLDDADGSGGPGAVTVGVEIDTTGLTEENSGSPLTAFGAEPDGNGNDFTIVASQATQDST